MPDIGSSAATAVCVLGMHRSGTSALARVLNLLGVDLGHNLLGGKVDNPKGFWEHRQILAIHADLLDALGSYFDDFLPLPDGWEKRAEVRPFREQLLNLCREQFGGAPLWGFKDPRTCRLVPLWRDLFAELGVAARYALVLRNPDEIARSLAIRNGYSYNKSLLLTLDHMLESELATRRFPRVLVTFDDLMDDWNGALTGVSKALGIDWPRSPDSVAGEVGAFLDPSLRHHRSHRITAAEQAVSLYSADEEAARLVFELYDVLAAGREGGAVDTAKVDDLDRRFRAMTPRLSAWRQLRSIDQKFMQVEAWGQRLDETVKRLAKDNNDLRLDLASRSSAGPAGSAPSEASSPDAAARAASLEATLAALQISSEEVSRDLAVHREAVLQRDGQIIRLQTQCRELDLAFRWLTAEKNAADAELAARAEGAAKLQKDLEWTAGEKAAADEEIKRQADAIVKAKQALDWLQSQKDAADRELEAARNELVVRAGVIESVRKDLAWFEAQKAAGDRELEAARNELSVRGATIESLQRDLAWFERQKSASDRELEVVRDELSVRGGTIEALRHDLKWFEAQKAASDGELAAANTELAVRASAIESLRRDLKWFEEQKAAADEALEAQKRDAEAERGKLQKWIAETTDAREWLARENARQADWVDRLQGEKSWLSTEVANLAADRDRLAALLRGAHGAASAGVVNGSGDPSTAT